jgi:hypothetical protein
LPATELSERARMRFSFLVLGLALGACASNPETDTSHESMSASAPSGQFCGGMLPDPRLTPGTLCTPSDPNFLEYRYAEHIPYCRRNVPTAVRDEVAKAYGIPVAELANYEMDHFLPLSIGGNDDATNLWPQPHELALEKDKLEDEVFSGMSAGTMTQAEAIAKIRAWRPSTYPASGCGGAQTP